jgi:NAD(P)-dependent dehydrogenase (short-subunit alcohol dehydrogenase family)
MTSEGAGPAEGVAVITGGASGFGLALGRACGARGMSVVLLDLDGDRAVSEAAGIGQAHGVTALGLGVDVAVAASVEMAALTVTDRFGRADLVLSNVGIQLFGSNEHLTDDEWRWVLDVNVVGSARVARAFVPLLGQAPQGRLAFTTSSSVLSPASNMAAYQTSKFAVWGLAESLRLELAGEGISVAVIFPSGMITRHLETSEGAQPDILRRPIATEADYQAMVASNPGMTAAVAAPDDIAPAVLDALLAGEPYVVTHGDLVEAVDHRNAALHRAAEAAR